MKPDTPAVSSFKTVAMFITACRQAGKYGLSQLGIPPSIQPRRSSNRKKKKDPQRSLTIGVISHCTNKPIRSHTLLCAVTSLSEPKFPQPTPSAPQQWQGFLFKMSFNFPLCMETAWGGLCLAHPLSFVPKLLISNSCIRVFYLFRCCVGQRPVDRMHMCGGICRSFDSLSTSDGGESLLSALPACQLRRMSVFGAWKQTLFSFLPLCSYRKKP